MLTIADDTGKQVRRLDLSKSPGVHRIAWNLATDAPAGGQGGRGGRGGGAGGDDQQPDQGFGGRGRQGGPPVTPGHYRATIGKQTGDTVTPIGQPQAFSVVPLPR